MYVILWCDSVKLGPALSAVTIAKLPPLSSPHLIDFRRALKPDSSLLLITAAQGVHTNAPPATCYLISFFAECQADVPPIRYNNRVIPMAGTSRISFAPVVSSGAAPQGGRHTRKKVRFTPPRHRQRGGPLFDLGRTPIYLIADAVRRDRIV